MKYEKDELGLGKLGYSEWLEKWTRSPRRTVVGWPWVPIIRRTASLNSLNPPCGPHAHHQAGGGEPPKNPSLSLPLSSSSSHSLTTYNNNNTTSNKNKNKCGDKSQRSQQKGDPWRGPIRILNPFLTSTTLQTPLFFSFSIQEQHLTLPSFCFLQDFFFLLKACS